MPNVKKTFVKSESGSFVPALAVALVPLVAAVGVVTDYSRGVAEKASMQAALDAASLSIMTLPKDMSTQDRQVHLQSAYEVNGGAGQTKLLTYDVAVTGKATISTSAAYDMPTDFMTVLGIKSVAIGVKAAARKNPALIEATFNVDHVSGYWGKTMYLYGTKFGETAANTLMKIVYTYKPYTYSYTSGNKTYSATDPKGYGTTSIYTVSGTTETLVQSQTCSQAGQDTNFTEGGNIFKSSSMATSGKTNGKTIYFKTTCNTTNYPAGSTGAKIDVSNMNQLYLLMNVPSGPVQNLRSDDPTTSNRLYIGAGYANATEKAQNPSLYKPIESENNKTVDIFSAVPCGKTSDQAWEDGGNPVPADVSNADFFYSITGKCDFSQRASETALTQ